MFCFEEVYFIGNLISSISLCNRNQCNGKTEMSEEVLLHMISNPFSFSATRNQCNGETEMFYFKEFYFIGNLISSISLQQEMKQKCFALKKFYFIGTLIPSISLQQEISAMVKQKGLYKVLFQKNSDTLYFSATRNQCNGETEMSL